MKKYFIVSLTTIIIFLFCSWSLYTYYFKKMPYLSSTEDVYYELQPGSTLMQMAYGLHRQGFLAHPKLFIWFVRHEKKTTSLQAGEYLFPKAATAETILNMMVNGKVIQYPFTIVEGWNINQLMQQLNQMPKLNHTLVTVQNDTLLSTLGLGQGSAEGLFYPDTYFFIKGMQDEVILKKAYHNMARILQTAWVHRASDLLYTTPYEALIVASLIEKETALPIEKPLISGVIMLRLERHMLLQIDASVIYGLQSQYTGTLTRDDLKKDTPYNTYLHYGLPPTPIAMPSVSSIEAALHPVVDTGYLYYVAKGDGTHVFSKTLDEQNKAVQQYQLNKP